jgi:hypothetical protein
MVKHGYVERVGNAYRVTDKVNIAETAAANGLGRRDREEVAEVGASGSIGPQ